MRITPRLYQNQAIEAIAKAERAREVSTELILPDYQHRAGGLVEALTPFLEAHRLLLEPPEMEK
jgi:hypothetical protein